MNRERAETYLRLVAEAELRLTMPPRDSAAVPRTRPAPGAGLSSRGGPPRRMRFTTCPAFSAR